MNQYRVIYPETNLDIIPSCEVLLFCKIHGDLTKTNIYFRVVNNRKHIRKRCKICYQDYYHKNKEKIGEKSTRRQRKTYNVKQQSNYLRRYNITIEQYEVLCKKQNNLCAICGNPETIKHHVTNITKRLGVDHCHAIEKQTGEIKIRGLLCQFCNQGLGRFFDSSELLRNAADYLDYNGNI